MNLSQAIDLQLPFFHEEGLKKAIMKEAKLAEVPAGTVILSEGQYVKMVPILLQGLAKVIREEAGKEILLYHIYPLESCIVSIHCGMRQLKSSVKAVVEENSMAIMLPSRLISQWQIDYPSFNEFVLFLYQKRFEDILDAFNALAFQKLDHRIMTFLRAKAEALQTHEIPMTHQDLADQLGTARESISRILKKLEADKQVALHRGWIEIKSTM